MARIFYVLGMSLLVLAGFELIPLTINYMLDSANWLAFAFSSFLTAFLGISLLFAGNVPFRRVSLREAYLLTVLLWIVLPIFGALPFLFDLNSMTFTDAFFESVSGVTTTGSSVINRLDLIAPGLLLWRSLLQWLGGLLFVLMGIAILPTLRVGGMQLMQTEISDGSSKALPRAITVGTSIVALYTMLTVLCMISYGLAGMSAFDAINHSMTTIATGGFSTHDDSFAYFSSPAIPWLAVFFMLSGALPFIIYLKALKRGPLLIIRNTQVIFLLKFCFLVVLLLTFWCWITTPANLIAAFSYSAFNAVSIITTTGYVNTDYTLWGGASVVFLIITFAGGCSGSTSGSIKIFRYQLVWSFLKSQLNRLVFPNGVFPVRYEGREVSADIILSVTAFLGLYLLTWCLLSAFLSLGNLDFQTSVSAAATALTNVGPGLGELIGPMSNFSSLDAIDKWLLILGMLLGRLELFTFFAVVTPRFWRDL
ncbi:MAG: potassium transporter TrkH [Rhodospirillaceae bacterium]|nr:potassium transporter TrkH [Rhodospirillaceae bacterium]